MRKRTMGKVNEIPGACPMRIEQRIMQKTVIGAPFVTSNIRTLLRSRLVVGGDEMFRTKVKRNMFNTRSLPKHN